MSKFKCENQECSLFEKFQYFAKLTWIYDEKIKKTRLRNPCLCEECGKELIEIKEEYKGDINFSFGSFSAKSDQEKKRILKKRAEDHTRAKMSDRVHSIKKKFGAI